MTALTDRIIHGDENGVRSTTIYGASIILIAIFLYCAISAYDGGNRVILVGNLVGLAIFLPGLAYLRGARIPAYLAYVAGFYLSVFVVVLAFSPYRGGVGIMWTLAAPPFAYLCVGTRIGFLLTACYVPVLLYVLYMSDIVALDQLGMAHRHRLVTIYLLIATISSAYSTAADRSARRLKEANERASTLENLLTMCMHCRKIQMDGEWNTIESFLKKEASIHVSHGICVSCGEQRYPEIFSRDPAK